MVRCLNCQRLMPKTRLCLYFRAIIAVNNVDRNVPCDGYMRRLVHERYTKQYSKTYKKTR